LEATTEFYCDGIGLEHSRDFTADGVTNYFVNGESDTEIQFKYDQARDSCVTPDGIDHLAVAVEDVRATFDELTTEWGSNVVKEPTEFEATGEIIAFVTDPDGYTVELIQ
jgi:lactoylglutathione lyase